MESKQQYYTGFGHPGVKLTGIEHTKNFWDYAYHQIIPISVSSGILFFVIFYLIATYIKYNTKHAKDKSLTYKQVLTDSTIIIIAIDLSIIVALLVYNHIDWMNPLPAPIAITLDKALGKFGITALIFLGLLIVTIMIILHNKKEKQS